MLSKWKRDLPFNPIIRNHIEMLTVTNELAHNKLLIKELHRHNDKKHYNIKKKMNN